MSTLNICRDVWKMERNQGIYIIYGLMRWFPNFESSARYQPASLLFSEEWWPESPSLLSSRILKKLSQQFPSVVSQNKMKEYHGVLKFQIIAVVALLAEHSFWFSGDDMEKQLSHAIKSFKSQKNIKLVQADIETAFNNTTDKEDSAWLIQLIIDNKLKHKQFP